MTENRELLTLPRGWKFGYDNKSVSAYDTEYPFTTVFITDGTISIRDEVDGVAYASNEVVLAALALYQSTTSLRNT